jgi:hypothetical protein
MWPPSHARAFDRRRAYSGFGDTGDVIPSITKHGGLGHELQKRSGKDQITISEWLRLVKASNVTSVVRGLHDILDRDKCRWISVLFLYLKELKSEQMSECVLCCTVPPDA